MAKMKPHRDGYEDEEDCCGYYDPDKAEERRCHSHHGGCSDSDLRMNNAGMTGRQCYGAWKQKETATRQQAYDALSDEEKQQLTKFLAGLRELY